MKDAQVRIASEFAMARRTYAIELRTQLAKTQTQLADQIKITTDMLAALKMAEQLLRDVAVADSGDPEQDAFERETHAAVLAAIAKAEGQPVIPIGHIDTIMGDTAPPGWLFCDGRDVKISDYPELFKLFANAGSTTPTTFRLPRFNIEKVEFPSGERVLRYVIKAEGL